MESLREVLVRTKGLSEEEAEHKILEAKELIDSGMSPEDVLVKLYGIDVEYLENILTPIVITVS